MSFDPSPKQELFIEGTCYQIAEHPAAPGIAYGQEGRAAIVYKLETKNQPHALKVFKSRFRVPTLASLAGKLAPFSSMPGLTVCRRSVLTPERHTPLLRQFPDLTYSVLMPWIEGPTWLQVVQERDEISPEQSLSLAQAFARILSGMEQRGIAHCDLSGANLIVPALEPDAETSSYSTIELVDVEQLFAPGLDHPGVVPSGSAGYAHRAVSQGTWENAADRYAGAVLLAEMLGWCLPQVREAAWGESFFDPAEMQRPSRRFDLLRQALGSNWGNDVAHLFEQTWSSELLADCPTLGEWLVAIPDSAPALPAQEKPPKPLTVEPDSPPPPPPLVTSSEPPKRDVPQADLLPERGSQPGPEASSVEMLERPPSKLSQAPANQPTPKKKRFLRPGIILALTIGCLLLLVLFFLWNNGDAIFEMLGMFSTAPTQPETGAAEAAIPATAQPVVSTAITMTAQPTAAKINIDAIIDIPTRFNTHNTIGNFDILTTLPGLPEENWVALFSPDGQYLAIGTYEQDTTLWQMSDLTLVRSLEKGGRPFIFAKSVTNELSLFTYPAPNPTEYYSWEEGHDWQRINQSLDSRASAISYDYWYYAQDDFTCQSAKVFPIYSPAGETPKERYSVSFPTGEAPNAACDVRFSPDGKFLALSKGAAGIIYNAQDGTNIAQVKVSGSSNLAFSPDGQQLSAGGYIYNTTNWNEMAALPGKENITQTTYSPDGTIIAIGTTGGKVEFWDPKDIRLVYSLQTPGTHPVTSLAFSPDGTKIVVAAGQPYFYGYHSPIKYVEEYNNPQNLSYMAPFDQKGGALASLSAAPGKLSFSVPNGERDLDPGMNMNSPRILSKVSGDFTIETKVKSLFQGAGYQSAGLLVWLDEGNFLNLTSSTAGVCTNAFIGKVNINTKNTTGKDQCQKPASEEFYLKIVRNGDEFSTFYAAEDGNWIPSWTLQLPAAPKTIDAGVFLTNSWADAQFAADFDYLRIR